MREIKFRAWEKKEKKMHEWNRHFFSDMSTVTGYSSDFPEDDEDMVLMQFTGLHDKNGKEIYEGDIVHTEDCEDNGLSSNLKVIFGDGGAFGLEHGDGRSAPGFYNYYLHSCHYNLTVIGNIYEHPELLA